MRGRYGVMHGRKYVAAHVLVKSKESNYNNNNKQTSGS